jgi:hypothetical protein
LILTATSRRMGCRMKVLAPAARGLSFNGATSAPATSRRRQRVNHHWEPHQPAPCWSCSSVGGWDRAISVLVPCVQFHGGFAFEWGYGCNPVLLEERFSLTGTFSSSFAPWLLFDFRHHLKLWF